MGDRTIAAALRCTAKAKSTGNQCGQPAVRGGTKCRYHGGKNQVAPPGSPERGGAPVRHGIYARFLRSDAERDAYHQSLVGDLEHELRFARARLVGLEERATEFDHQPGDLTGDGAKGSNWETWDQGRRHWLKLIAQLEEAQRRLATDDDDDARAQIRSLVDGIRKRRR